jgi:D-aspartate ligase
MWRLWETPVEYSPDDLASERKGIASNLRMEKPVLPALVLGAGITALGVTRSLGRIGIPVYNLCGKRELPAKSRWYRPAPLMGGRVPLPNELARYLEGLELPAAVLIACSDDWARAVSELTAALQRRFPASTPPPSVMHIMTDKWQFAEAMRTLDIPHPKTLLLRSTEEMQRIPEFEYRDKFLKPLNSQEFSLRTGAKALRPQNKNHAIQIMTELSGKSSAFPILLQEYIEGPVTNIFLVDGFVDRHGDIRGWFARRRLRMYPPGFGNSSYSETIPLHDVRSAVESIEKLCSALPFRGIFDAEFKYDPRDGHYKIIEVNARPWWFVEFATRSGVNLCEMAYLDAQGLPVPLSTGFQTGRRCAHMALDFAGYWNTDRGIGAVWRWKKSLKGAEDAVFSRDDPKPGIWNTIMAMRSHLRRILSRTDGRATPVYRASQLSEEPDREEEGSEQGAAHIVHHGR